MKGKKLKTWEMAEALCWTSPLANFVHSPQFVVAGVREWECLHCSAEVTDIKVGLELVLTSQSRTLQVHMKVHSTEKKWKCEECGTFFRHKNSLVRHR